jgi:uncharacterized SAM-dependent methyltransferase
MLAGRRTESAQGSRIEMHLMSRQRQRVQVRASPTDITFDACEEVQVSARYS